MSTGFCSVSDKGSGSLKQEWSNRGAAPHLEAVTTGLRLDYRTKRLCLCPVRFYITQPRQQRTRLRALIKVANLACSAFNTHLEQCCLDWLRLSLNAARFLFVGAL